MPFCLLFILRNSYLPIISAPLYRWRPFPFLLVLVVIRFRRSSTIVLLFPILSIIPPSRSSPCPLRSVSLPRPWWKYQNRKIFIIRMIVPMKRILFAFLILPRGLQPQMLCCPPPPRPKGQFPFDCVVLSFSCCLLCSCSFLLWNSYSLPCKSSILFCYCLLLRKVKFEIHWQSSFFWWSFICVVFFIACWSLFFFFLSFFSLNRVFFEDWKI